MNTILIIGAVVFLALGVLVNKNNKIKNEPSSFPAQTASLEEKNEDKSEENGPEAPFSPKPTQVNESVDKQIMANSIWVYPNSSLVGEGIYKSGDSPDKITQWYREKIDFYGYDARNFIKTSSNDNVKNVITAAKGNQKINIEISRSGDSEFTRIEIEQN